VLVLQPTKARALHFVLATAQGKTKRGLYQRLILFKYAETMFLSSSVLVESDIKHALLQQRRVVATSNAVSHATRTRSGTMTVIVIMI